MNYSRFLYQTYHCQDQKILVYHHLVARTPNVACKKIIQFARVSVECSEHHRSADRSVWFIKTVQIISLVFKRNAWIRVLVHVDLILTARCKIIDPCVNVTTVMKEIHFLDVAKVRIVQFQIKNNMKKSREYHNI